jgi:hypothetical protein
MKTMIPLSISMAVMICSTFGQTGAVTKRQPSGPGDQQISSPAYGEQQGAVGQNQTGQDNSLSFSNSAGQVFTVQALAQDLRNLNDAVVKTMPALTAFNDAVSGSGANQTLAGAISNLVSGALNKNASQSNTPSSQGSPIVNALMAELRGQGAAQATTDPNLTKDLARLRNDLQPVAPLLQNLVATTVNAPPEGVISSPRGTNAEQTPISPTGR